MKLKAKINGKWVELFSSDSTDNDSTNTGSSSNTPTTDTLKYGDSINKPFEFEGKKIIWYGDSITSGVKSGTATGDGYAKIFCDKVGATLTNRAVSGAKTISSETQPGLSVYSLMESHTGFTADYIFIATGTNDYANNVPIGAYGDDDTTNFYGALKGICEMLKTKAPNIPVVFITPINRTKYVSNPSSLDDYRNAIYEVATTYGHSVVDGSSLGLPSVSGSAWATFMNADGIHPTADGHKLYARSLCGKLL